MKITTGSAEASGRGFLADRLRAKGWTIRDAAEYLGVSRQRLYTTFSDPDRPKLWQCAIDGMPACTPEIKLSLKLARDRKPRPKPRLHMTGPEFEVGDEVMASKHAGIGDEGQCGEIAALRGEKDSLQLLVRMEDGEDWFPVHLFHEYFATTGLNLRKQDLSL